MQISKIYFIYSKIPTLLNRHNHNVFNDYHNTKLNVAKWIRKNENMRNPEEISLAIGRGYEFLYECMNDYYEDGHYYSFFNDIPDNVKKFVINYLD